MNLKGYETYGCHMISTYQDTGNENPLLIQSEDELPIKTDSLISFAKTGWKLSYAKNPHALGLVGKSGKTSINYRFQAVKFGMKVICMTHQLLAIPDIFPGTDWALWIDADVVYKRKLDKEFFDAVTFDQALVTYIGRTGWDHSECGFMAFRVAHPTVRHFLQRMNKIYTTGEVFRYPEWHDSYIFDVLRTGEFSGWQWAFKNIAEGIEDMHPWPHTILGKYMDHHKGPQAKQDFYGSST